MKKIITLALVAVTSFLFISVPVFAEDGSNEKCVLTSVVGDSKCDKDGNKDNNGAYNCSCDDGGGSSISHILNLVVDIMTIGVGILGVIGISVVGIQYLTAGGNEEKTRTAKRRIFEIIIGLAIYAIVFALLKWLLPSFQA